MSSYGGRPRNLLSQLKQIDVDDLQYVERDLCFHELVSLGFLLFGDERSRAELVLQKLLVLANTYRVSGNRGDILLRPYATINPTNWRAHVVEALSIIGSRRVLRKLGFQWEELRHHYLPHVSELSLHIHPLIKALYKMCERLTPAQAGRLVLKINESRQRTSAEYLRFYDYAYLEVFVLDWITRRIISVGDHELNGANVDVLLEYFKFNDMDGLKELLLETINHNTMEAQIEGKPRSQQMCDAAYLEQPVQEKAEPTSRDCSAEKGKDVIISNHVSLPDHDHERYIVRREQAGIVLIINQSEFHEESDEELKHLLPKEKLRNRNGTNVDRDRLKSVFASFGYRPVVFENLNHIDLLHYIRETVKRSLLCDSLVVCILSHGMEGVVYGSNSIPVEISEIEQIITGDTLHGKPKLLIIQACQKNKSPASVNSNNNNSYIAAHAYADMIKAMSTVPGYESMRHTQTGTWFIQSLCQHIDQLGNKKHLLDILTAVTRDVANKKGDDNEIMVPMTSFTLRKDFYLPSRESET